MIKYHTLPEMLDDRARGGGGDREQHHEERVHGGTLANGEAWM